MNAFRLAGDITHLISILVLLLKIYATRSCSGKKKKLLTASFYRLAFRFSGADPVRFFTAGISLKTQDLYAVVFLARYLDLFTDFISVYNSVMKVVFILSLVLGGLE
ncbi:hypothetical protein ACLB2K_048041 [Fragaria x ananassa]